MEKKVLFNLDWCPHCGDNIGRVPMYIEFDPSEGDWAKPNIFGGVDISCSCGRIKVRKDAEYEVLEWYLEGNEVIISAIGAEIK